MDEGARANLAWWNERVAAHAASPTYEVARFAEDPDHLSHVVRFDRDLLGDISGLDVVHLQCHIGTDTVSLARLGADITGVDFSAPALEQARRLSTAAAVDAVFVRSELYETPPVFGGRQFDLVYTGVGALNWLPDVRRWAQVVAALLRPGGRLHIREGHPVLWALCEVRPDGLLALDFPYFEVPDGLVWTEPDGGTTYAQTDQVFATDTTHEWNHGLGEIVTSLIDAGMQITQLVEHDSAPFDAMPGLMTDIGGGEWRLTDRPLRLPHSYTLQARRA